MLKFIFSLLLILFLPQSKAFTLIENVTISNERITIPINGYNDPLIFASVPTYNDIEPGVISISNVTTNSFDVQFKEWPYLDGIHGEEFVSFLVIEKGRHHLEDGSIWEAGKFSLKTNSSHIFFNESFFHIPGVFLSGQTQNNSDAYSLRASSVSRQTFGVSLNKQESSTAHFEEEIAYLAIYKDSNAGNTDEGLGYNLVQEAINEFGFQTRNGNLFLQEEQSKDTETNHLLEVVSLLTLKNKLFGQDNTNYGKDTISLRVDSSSTIKFIPGETTGQFGNIALIGTNDLTETSYSASHSYALDSPSGAFDGYNSSIKVNTDTILPKIKRGIWLSTIVQEHWLQVAFKNRAYITSFRVMLYSGASDPGMGVKDVTLQVSDDNINFLDHESFNIPKTLDNIIELSTPAIGRYIRLKINTTHGHSYRAIGELEYYGGFVATSTTEQPEPEPPLSNAVTCETIKQENPQAQSGIYEIDPDGDNGITPFYAQCEMDHLGGGWTLIAHHKDGLDDIAIASPLTANELGVISNTHWHAIKSSMTTGMMFIDEYGNVSKLSKSKLDNANCVSPNEVTDLSHPPLAFDTAVIWQDETSGCSLSGLDYSFVSLSIESTSRGDNYTSIGAALYQNSIKFDIWPYFNSQYSGAEQDSLFYYVK